MNISTVDTVYSQTAGSERKDPVPPAPVACESKDLPALFNRLFSETKDRLYHFVWKMTRDESETKDILQNCYIRLWQKIDAIDTERDVLPLLYTYARNLVLDHYRNKCRRQLLLENLEKEPPATAAAAGAEQLLSYKERLRQLHDSIEQLPSKRKQIFTLVKQEGLSHKTVADRLGISTATVEKQVVLSLRFLKKQLNY